MNNFSDRTEAPTASSPLNGGLKPFSIASINVCGLTRKLEYEEFITFVQSKDLLLFQETKSDDVDSEILHSKFLGLDYTLFWKNRSKLSTRRSGGLAVAVKNEHIKKIHHITTESSFVQWISISKNVLNSKCDLLIGNVYVPPESSPYSAVSSFDEIDSELLDISSRKDCEICLAGDFNAHTNNRPDYIIDQHINSTTDVPDVLDPSEEAMEDVSRTLNQFRKFGVNVDRLSSDTKRPDNYGNRLLELCRSHSLYILNGRVGNDKLTGQLTTTTDSIVDYFIGTCNLVTSVSDMWISPFDSLFSDLHCRVCVNITMQYNQTIPVNQVETEDTETTTDARQIFKWESSKKDQFRNNLDTNRLAMIEQMIDEQSSPADVSRLLTEVIIESAKLTFNQRRNSSRRKKKRENKPWFDSDCRMARNNYISAKRTYARSRISKNREDLQRKSKSYKKVMNRAIVMYKRNLSKKIQDLRSSNPREFWRLINEGENEVTTTNLRIGILKDHFQKLNKSDDGYHELNLSENSLHDDPILDGNITEDEVLKAIKSLKLGKSPGCDSITNEFLKCSADVITPVLTKLFNVVLTTGQIPDEWVKGLIVPVFKKKGDPEDVNNYRGITLLSCVGKLFTAILNTRLTEFIESRNILSENQAGFRRGHSTTDHVFLLKCLIDLYLSSGRKLYVAFVDYSKAFDMVWRLGLWQKLISYGIRGRTFRVIYNMYKGIKSSVLLNGRMSPEFPCFTGVRQGENLSPLLFSLFVNDIQDYLCNLGCNSLNLPVDNPFKNYLKLLVVLYADDTVLLSDTPEGLQQALNSLQQYCDEWKLKVNESKTKVIVFCKRKSQKPVKFHLNNRQVEVVDTFVYLGVMFNYNGSFAKCRKYVVTKANRAMWALVKKCRRLSLPLSVQLKLFDQTVVPILLFGCEIWGLENLKIIEAVHMKFCKLVLKVNKSTPSCMVLGELGRYPLEIIVKQRIVSFWGRLITGAENKYSSLIHSFCFDAHENNKCVLSWFRGVRNIFDELGLSHVWLSQTFPNRQWLNGAVKQRLSDQATQVWRGTVYNSSKCSNYRLYKSTLSFETYLDTLPRKLSVLLCKFRCSNIKLPVEAGRYRDIPRYQRTCTKCDYNVVGDEFHFVLECPFLLSLRNKYLPKELSRRPNIIKFENLMSHKQYQFPLCKFLKEGIQLYI